MAGLGSASGPLIGGVITTAVSWRLSFASEVLLVIIIVLLHRRIVDASARGAKPKLDIGGAVLSAIGMAAFSLDLYFASRTGMPATGSLIGLGEFLRYGSNWRIATDLLFIAISGGVFVVPLYAILQARSDENKRSRIVAANNIVNALFMVAGAIAAALMLAASFTIPEIFFTVAVVTILVAIYICGLLPDELVKGLRGRSDEQDLLLLVRVPRDVVQRAESSLILPGDLR